ncbi:MAG: prepilin-type N-terminal cleavage/methylation domain-containing protein [Dehalococcoidia bacterium]
MGRRGFTLVELLVALALLGIVSVSIYRVLVGNQRMYHAQTQRIELQESIRAAATILPAEFRELAATEGDIYAMSATEIRMRAMRQFDVLCRAPVLGGGTGGLGITLFRDLHNGPTIVVGDSLLVYYEGDELSRSDDSWVTAVVTGVSGSATCPDGVTPGVAVTVTLVNFPTPPQVNRAGAIPAGGPARGFDGVRYALYQSGTDDLWYLGLDVQAGGIQPLIGPLSGSDGLTLTYFNGGGAITAVPDSVAMIEIRLRGRTADPVQGAQGGGLRYPVDSVVTRVTLRNNRRF